MSSFLARSLAGVVILLIGGCATPVQTRAILEAPVEEFVRQVELADIPFYAQEDHQCGPAALAMVLNAVGIAVDPESLKPEVYLPHKQGSLQIEMLATARRYGLVAYRLKPHLASLLAEVADGTPVIVLQNLGLSWFQVWHYAVVVGYDLERREIILRSGREKRQVIPLTTFERTWARGGHWAMVALPPGKIPRSAEEVSYVSAVSALERMGQFAAARRGYLAAVERWPRSLAARIGAGNAAYRMRDLEQAEVDFRQAVTIYPDSVAALNNLAQTLSDLGRDEEALQYVRRAMVLGGPLRDIVLSTQAAIEKKLAAQ